MKIIKALICIFLFTNFSSFAQSNFADTIYAELSLDKLNFKDIDSMPLNGSSSFIKKIIGEYVYENNVALDTSASVRCNIKRSILIELELKRYKTIPLENSWYYTFHYQLIINSDTLNYFNLSVDSLGNLVKYKNAKFDISSPVELLEGFGRLFQNGFKVNYLEACTISKKYGLINKPKFEYNQNEKSYSWFFVDFSGLNVHSLKIDAVTGLCHNEHHTIVPW